MRRATSSLLAAGYALSFVVVCLAACLAPSSAGEHACCPEGEGWSVRAADCCSVVPGVAGAGAGACAPCARPAPAVLAVAAVPALVAAGPERRPPLAVTPSPPLVLRV
jgi:hypothetical protein